MTVIQDTRRRPPAASEPQVLADHSGLRLRVVAFLGPLIALLFLLWLLGVVVAGLAIFPTGPVPLGTTRGPSHLHDDRLRPPAHAPRRMRSAEAQPSEHDRSFL